ncbi:MAG: VacB/RNase II family 3'-5' exoribonuclease [Planctomycetes bacterium]|nr:VacB/RNase II family 3'-5' exoribonuclease [Planctomycetota bacterium]
MLPSTADLIRHIDRHPGEKTRQLAARFGVAEDELDDFVELLLRLQLDGSAIRLPGAGWDVPERTEHRVGSLKVARGGHGYVRAAAGTIKEEDFFVRASDLKGAVPGDTVLLKLEKPSRSRGRDGAGERLRQGKVADIVRRSRSLLRGRFLRRGEGGSVTVADGRVSLEVDVPPGDTAGARNGDQVLVRLLDGAPLKGQPKGKVVVRLQDEGSYATDLLVIREVYELPGEFSRAVLAEVEAFEDIRDGAAHPGRVDLRGEQVFTIDPVDAKDFDDAVSIEELPGGDVRLGVHIADVSQYVRPGSALDREAMRRGTSVYLPGHVIPMLPERLSNGLASLRPDEDRLTKTVRLTYGAGGKLKRSEVFPSVIRSCRRFTYEEVLAILSYLETGEAAPGLPADHAAFEGALSRMARVRDRLHEARYVRGALYLDIPKLRLTLDASHQAVGIGRDERDPSHALIEELMLAANEAVAAYFKEKRLPLVGRVHPPPEERKVEQLKGFVEALGFRFGARGDQAHFQRLVEQTAGDPLSAVVQLALLRTMGHAEYIAGAGLHYALATASYCHFTSPIRRYPDLLVHQVLDEHFSGELAKASRRAEWDARLPHAAERSSELERRAEEAERDMTQLRLVRYLKPLVGEEMDARIVSVHPFGFFVREEETLVEGLVHVATLDDDYYELDERSHALQGRRTRKRFGIGERVRVELWDANPDEREISFRFKRRLRAPRSGR